MDVYGDEPPRRVLLLAGGVVVYFAVGGVNGLVGVFSAFAASATGGAVGTSLDTGMGLVDEAVQFLVGCTVAAVVLGVILAVTHWFESRGNMRDDGAVTESEDPDENRD